MKELFYRCLMCISAFTGAWFFSAMAWCVATGYFILFPRRVAISVNFYKALFPARGFPYHLWCAWRQFHNFTTVFLDRWVARKPGTITYSAEGREHIDNIARDGTGGIMLMSHLGNWELGAAYLGGCADGPAIRLLLYLGEKEGEQIERLQKQDLAQHGIQIITTKQDEASPFDVLEGINFLKDGGFVSMTGDRLWSQSQRSVAVRFLGHEIRIPEAPFLFAMLSGAPLIIFFVNRCGKNSYHCTLFPPCAVNPASRSQRHDAVQQAAQQYADRLEIMVRRHPLEWYHFEQFLRSVKKGTSREAEAKQGISLTG
jgi:predicted LPLAT superfamily acyltransferase